MATSAAIPDLDRLRPAGTKRSSKRDLIVNAFLKQEGHLSADDLVALTKRDDRPYQPRHGLPHAAVDGRGGHRSQSGFRRRPVPLRAFLSASAALSPHLQDLQSLGTSFSAPTSRRSSKKSRPRAAFTARQSVVQIYGTCEACTPGRRADEEPANSELLFARDALRIAIATERSGMEFYGRGVKLVKDPRAREIFRKLATEEVHHLKTLENRYQELLKQDPQLESRPTFLFFKGAANGLFSSGTEQLLPRRRRRSRGLSHRHPLRARLAPFLQALRRALRGFGRQAHLPRVCGRRARAPRTADSRIPARS